MEYLWDHSTIGGSDKGLIKVIASDGLREGSAISRPFQLPKKAPKISILSPRDEAIFREGEPITLFGLGYDPEDGELNGESLRWWLDGTNILGTGRSLRINGLPQKTEEGLINMPINPGIHTITLTATDSDENRVGVQIHIKIVQEAKEKEIQKKTVRK
jgi:hypothetical protein